MVNGIMEKKIYYSPLIEVEKVNLVGVILTSPIDDTPPPPYHPGSPAPARRRLGVVVF